ncbi:hypothetical protein D6833_12365 [Candidatus Parcubacteria bacterium]|nr:MAG: hypothetical protein D6833_12365 [Candidatus Parcubacteria bacterium]
MKQSTTRSLLAGLLVFLMPPNLFGQLKLEETIEGAPIFSVSMPNITPKCDFKQCMDFDGDGVQDFTLDGKGNDPVSDEIIIISGADPNQRWQIPLPNGIIGILVGFMDLDGNAGSNGAVKEIVLAQKSGRRLINPTVLYNIDPETGANAVHIFDNGTVLMGGWDNDADGKIELIIGDRNRKEVQVWGLP